MNRATRQSKILNIIASRDVETQEDLVCLLRKNGCDVTQATVSRDIKELGIIKTLTANGKYKYATMQKADSNLSVKLLNIVRETVISVVTANNLCVVKTIGIVADRSTVLIVCNSAKDAGVLAQEINRLLD